MSKSNILTVILFLNNRNNNESILSSRDNKNDEEMDCKDEISDHFKSPFDVANDNHSDIKSPLPFS